MAKNREIQNHDTPGLPEGGEGGEGVREAASSMPPEGTTTTESRSGNRGGRPTGSRNRNPTKNAAPRKAASKLPPNSAPTGGMTPGMEKVIPLFVNIGKCVAELRGYGFTEAQILSGLR